LSEEEVIRFTAIVSKVSTLQYSGLRISLDLNEDCIEQVGALMEVKRLGYILEVVCIAVKDV